MSKFILALDSTQIHEYLTCPLKWYYHYKENLELKTTDKKWEAANKGSLMHMLLELYYNLRSKGMHVHESCGAAIILFKQEKETLKLFPDDTKFELENFLCSRFTQYVLRYENSDFQLVEGGVELGFSKLLFENDDVQFIVEGRIDLAHTINNGYEKLLCWTDHKTQSKTDDLYKYKIQFKTYAWATGYPYGMINYIGLQEDKNCELMKANKLFRRDLIYFPPEMIIEWEQKLLKIFWDIFYAHKYIYAGSFEKPFYVRRNEGSCSGAFDSNPCQFTHLCEEYNWEMKQRIKEFKYDKVEAWTPWKIK